MDNINWLSLSTTDQLDEAIENSRLTPCIIYKHSTRCSLSSLVRRRLEKGWPFDERTVLPYFLDLAACQEASKLVAERFKVVHQSPQILLIKDGRCLYHASHLDISARSLEPFLSRTEHS